MKKLFTLTCFTLALLGCKTEIEKEISLNQLLTQPIKTETALLNVEIVSCHSHEDSRLESNDLIKIKQKIPTVFKNANFKECYSKRSQSFASFEIPVAVGHIEENNTPKEILDITIYSIGNRYLNIKSSPDLAKNIRHFLKTEFIPKFDFNIVLNVKNDTEIDHKFNLYSAYLDDSPVDILPINLKKGDGIKIKLSNASADILWRYENGGRTLVLGERMDIK